MGSKLGREASVASDSGSVAVLKRGDEAVKWHVDARVDQFDIGSVILCAEALGLKHREPTGPELLAWAEATRGEARGDRVVHAERNLLTRLGLRRLGALWIGETATASQALNATHCRLGVGNSSTAAATTDTDLSAAAGSSNRQFKLVDSVAQGTGANSGVTTIIATFGTGVANFAWAEWCIDGGTADGTTVTSETASTPGMQNRKVTSLGTKTSAGVWVFTVTVTIA